MVAIINHISLVTNGLVHFLSIYACTVAVAVLCLPLYIGIQVLLIRERALLLCPQNLQESLYCPCICGTA